MTICSDLWHDIVSYIPHSDLRDFAKGHPKFWQMIYKSGIRIFYADDGRSIVISANNNRITTKNALDNDIRIIQMTSGKKYVLKKTQYHFDSLLCNNTIYEEHIQWVIRADPNLYWIVDHDAGVAVHPGQVGHTIFTSSWAIRGMNNVDNKLRIESVLSQEMDYIDFKNYRAMCYDFDDHKDFTKIALEDFTVLYQGGCWINRGPTIGI